MARSSRVVLNRSKLEQVTLGVADGLAAVCTQVLEQAQVPDAPPYGVGLVDTGDFGVWVNGRKVDGGATKPRALRLSRPGVTAAVGYGFPGRFQEFGTIHHPARPFLTPAVLGVVPSAAPVVRDAIKARVR